MLSAESLNPEHPLHDEFTARMEDGWENYSGDAGLIPPQLVSWKWSLETERFVEELEQKTEDTNHYFEIVTALGELRHRCQVVSSFALRSVYLQR